MRQDTKVAKKTEAYRDLHKSALRLEDHLEALYRQAEDLYYGKLDEHKVYRRRYKERVGHLANSLDACIKHCKELESFLEELALFKHGIRL